MTGQNEHERAFEDDHGFEASLRDLMAQDARSVRPVGAPYPDIVKQGRLERRRRLAVAGAALAVLTLVPAGAFAFSGSGDAAEGDSVAGPSRPGGGDRPVRPVDSPDAPPPAAGPAGPATPGQLADGITMKDAVTGLEKCLAYNLTHPAGSGAPDLGKPEDYRIILAHRATGNDNTPGDGQYIVAVKAEPKETRLICTVKKDDNVGINSSVGGDRTPDSGAVVPDVNGGKLFLQRLSSEGPWRLPYRWGSIGTVDDRVAKVTVSYGGTTVEAALDHGWFAATGILERRVTAAPRIKGFDAQGKEVYDSDKDRSYDKQIP
ncbi:hypothetical protein DEJ50_31465 [Streptomyces venezuelae]|uniref:Uncharacterized protein n=2 Tax=Streptomyces venezuelae TaxID=54571 RepID=A0A5P2DEM3_STRVZ|nr:hypothetical protein DEJ50_31465 [Streptomyces venezuelae]